MLPLKGIKVVDFTHAVAGPFCSMMLADMGAEVVKVEPLWGEHFRPVMNGTVCNSVNRNKRDIALDLTKAEGRGSFPTDQASRYLCGKLCAGSCRKDGVWLPDS